METNVLFTRRINVNVLNSRMTLLLLCAYLKSIGAAHVAWQMVLASRQLVIMRT